MSRPLLVAVLMALLALLAAAPALAAPDRPKIVFEQTEAHFANVKEGQPLQAKFSFTNQGKMNLIIDKVSPSCGCQVAKFDRVVPPGGKGVVTMDLDTEGITGAFRKTAVVSTNDPSNPYVTLVMMGETMSRIVVDKGRRIDLVGCADQGVATTATLSDPDKKPFLIAGVENNMSDYLEAKLEPMPGGRQYKLHLRAKTKEPMQFAGPVYLLVPGTSKVSLFVVADVRGPFTVRPHEVFFGGLTRGMTQGATRSILVNKACADSLAIEQLVYNHDHFKVEEQWQTPGNELLLVVTPNLDQLPPGPFDEKLGIQAQGKLFNVRLKGSVREPQSLSGAVTLPSKPADQ